MSTESRDGQRRDVRIVPLTGHHEFVDVLAGWQYGEYAHLYADEVWNLDVAHGEFAGMAEPGARDLTLIALGDDIVGCASLLATDDLDGFEHLTPWLANVYVRPDLRRQGLATALISAIVNAAAAAGHRTVYLFTTDSVDFYLDRGWRIVTSTAQNGAQVTVMSIATSTIPATLEPTAHSAPT
jgi:N-acetylglutamate synthase-like GNAT family acetyltransferase